MTLLLYLIKGDSNQVQDEFFIMQCHWHWHWYFVMPIISSIGPLHSLGHTLASAPDDADSITNGTIPFLMPRPCK